MEQDNQREQQAVIATTSHDRRWFTLRSWLLGSTITLLLLIAAALLIAPQFIDSASLKQKIQGVVTAKTGGQIDYQSFNLSYLPRPTIELDQVTLAIPDQLEATVATLRVFPDVLRLLIGDLHLGRLEIETPQLNLKLPETQPAPPPDEPFSFTELEKNLTTTLEPLVQVIPELDFSITHARVTIVQRKQTLATVENLSLEVGLSLSDSHSALANLQANLSELVIFQKEHQQEFKNISLKGNAQIVRGKVTITLDQLALAEPAIDLTGDLTLAQATPAIILNLSSTNIDVDATRKTALALAGDSLPIKEIFNYLHGGQIPQISFTSHGDTPADLGDLNNILIKGQLQEGKISIPEIELDLTEVIGDVIVSKGVLQGTKLSTRLEGSTGHDGSLKVALGENDDLFQLELMLDANLAKVQTILERVVDAPAFIAELRKITKLQGAGHGRLTLGDTLNDINAKVEINDLQLSARHQMVPLPITITKGQFNFSKKQSTFSKLSGTVGESKFADLSFQLLWEKDLSLDIRSGQFNLVTAELYPWLASTEGMRDNLKEVKRVTGRLDLSTVKIKGPLDKPSLWKFSAAGEAKDLSIDTALFPEKINIARGGLKIDTKQLSIEKLQTTSQDAALNLTGIFKGFPHMLERIELSVDGRMGPKSVQWFSDKLEVPRTYAIKAPLNINKALISWQPDSTTSFNGSVSIENGPTVSGIVYYNPEQLQVQQLLIKDQYSDANMALNLREEKRDIKFQGTLHGKTMQALFVDKHVNTGQLEGDFALTIPQTGQFTATATGQLTGKNLMVLMPSDEEMFIKQVTLNANGPQVAVDISKLKYIGLTWEPVKATVTFHQNEVDIKLAEVKMCGIEAPGVISIIDDEFSLDIALTGKDLDVATSYTCLREGQVKMTGNLDFSSQVTATGQIGELVKSLKGPLKMNFSNGVIEQDKMLARTLEVLNVTEIVKGRLPNLNSTGFVYSTIQLEGEFKNGKLILPTVYMDSETLDLIGHGEINLEDEAIDGQVLAAPFQTIDSVVNMIPGISYILGGGLVTIPISITGHLHNPEVSVLSVTAVGTSLLDLAERLVKSPFKLIESLFSWGKDDKK